MASRSGSRKKSGSTTSEDAGDKDLIAELKNRVAVLENELRSKQDATSSGITERKQIIEKLAEQEKFLRNMFECIQDGISVLDKDLNIIQVNPAMEKRYGGHITGKKCYQAYHGRSEPCEMCPSIRAMKTKSTQTEIVHDLSGWSEIYAFPLVNDRGEVTGVIEHVRDINERKLAEKALRESEEKLRQLAENIKEVFFIFTPDWKHTIYVSPAYERVWGRPLNEVYGNSLAWLEGVHPDDRLLPLAIVNKHIGGNISEMDTVEFRVLRPDGMVKSILARTYPILDEEGNIYRITGIAEDITERKQAEEEMKAAKQQSELYLDLMGHDINNMHQVALGYLELARDMPPGDDQDTFLDKPVEVLQRSTQLIQNVRKLQKLKDGVFRTREVDVCEVLRDVQREFGAVPNKAVTLNTNECEQCLVRANELLHDVFANLVSNAIKHTRDRTDIIIDMDVLKDSGNKYCRVMIEDNGPGIPDDFKSVIFNRELRGKSKARGMGLGLYLVKSLVDSYGGRVWVEDRIVGDHSKGARFVVMLQAIEK